MKLPTSETKKANQVGRYVFNTTFRNKQETLQRRTMIVFGNH